jgi:alkanesulfonate monooxygenase SsuD/methylene tetrahydromethanopterin reductase-like flavin-dependent oxidoreductase (luciferase family)
VIGTPEKVAQQLHDWAKKTSVNEIMLVDGYAEIEARKKGYTLLAKEFGL